jgi:phage terminase large subunit-like protein
MSQARSPNNNSREFCPFTEQEQFLRADKRYIGYVSGVGAGKTWIGNVRTLLNMTQWNQGEMGAIVAPTRQMIVNVIIPQMREMGLLEDWEYKSSYADEPGLHTPEGSRALLLSADNQKTIERLRGLNLAWAWVDEEAVVDPRAREILMQRLRTGNYRNLYITTTPKGKNHTYDFFVGEHSTREHTVGEATVYETDDRLAIVGVPTAKNPHTPDDYKEAMQQDLPDDIRAQEVRGEFVEIGSGVFSRDMITMIPPEDVKQDLRLSTVIAVDPATKADAQSARENDADYWAATVIQVPRVENFCFVTDTARRRGMSLTEGVEWVRQIALSATDPTVIVEANQSQRWLQQQLADAGLNALPAQSTTNKEDRLIDLSIPLENDRIKFIDWNHESDEPHPYQELVSELLAFPEGSHDDLIDSLHLAVSNAPVSMGRSIMGVDGWQTDE